jgi:ABC-type nitrate/sulfonate/bicarbonate transport system permease component
MISDRATVFHIHTMIDRIVVIGIIGPVLNGLVAVAEAKIVHRAGR